MAFRLQRETWELSMALTTLYPSEWGDIREDVLDEYVHSKPYRYEKWAESTQAEARATLRVSS